MTRSRTRLPPVRHFLSVDDLDPAELAEIPVYGARGTWISRPLDSDHYRCQWHRVALDMKPLPAGTRVVISTPPRRDHR